jgi:hypothetical protein
MLSATQIVNRFSGEEEPSWEGDYGSEWLVFIALERMVKEK